jgi:acetate kinase
MDTKKMLVINCGSSSLKYEVYAMPRRESLGKGLVERIGEEKGMGGQVVWQNSDWLLLWFNSLVFNML